MHCRRPGVLCSPAFAAHSQCLTAISPLGSLTVAAPVALWCFATVFLHSFRGCGLEPAGGAQRIGPFKKPAQRITAYSVIGEPRKPREHPTEFPVLLSTTGRRFAMAKPFVAWLAFFDRAREPDDDLARNWRRGDELPVEAGGSAKPRLTSVRDLRRIANGPGRPCYRHVG